jgi:hypothetical protein
MDGAAIAAWEWLIILVIVLGIGVRELWSVRRGGGRAERRPDEHRPD